MTLMTQTSRLKEVTRSGRGPSSSALERTNSSQVSLSMGTGWSLLPSGKLQSRWNRSCKEEGREVHECMLPSLLMVN